MTQQRQAQSVIAREVDRIARLSRYPVHPGYVAIVAKAHALGLPQRHATDITIHDRLLIASRQPRQFAWRADTAAAACSAYQNQTSGHWTISTPHDGSTVMRCRSGGMAVTSFRYRISTS